MLISTILEKMHFYDEDFRICPRCGIRDALLFNPFDEKKLPNGKKGIVIRCRDPLNRKCPYWVSSTKFCYEHESAMRSFAQKNHRELNN